MTIPQSADKPTGLPANGAPFSQVITFAELPARRASDILLAPTPAQMAAIAADMGINGLRKMRFMVTLTPRDKADWHLSARLGATVIQPCVVTLDPVTTRIEDVIERIYLTRGFEASEDENNDNEDDRVEPLPISLDLAVVALEALALALPAYPRSKDAGLGEAIFTEPGKAAMTNKDARPFAGLADLVNRQKPEDDPG